MKKAILILIIALATANVEAKSDKPQIGNDSNEPNTPKEQIQTKFFKIPLRIGEKYRLGGDNVLVSIEKADGGGFIGRLTAGGKSVNVWCRGFGSSRPGSRTKYDRTLTVSGTDTYNGVAVYIIEPWKSKR